MPSKLVEFIAVAREVKKTAANVIRLIAKVGKYGQTFEDISVLRKVNKSLKLAERILEQHE